nr:MAG TPA: hypothetical protein [Caudoviricetes sp.]
MQTLRRSAITALPTGPMRGRLQSRSIMFK